MVHPRTLESRITGTHHLPCRLQHCPYRCVLTPPWGMEAKEDAMAENAWVFWTRISSIFNSRDWTTTNLSIYFRTKWDWSVLNWCVQHLQWFHIKKRRISLMVKHQKGSFKCCQTPMLWILKTLSPKKRPKRLVTTSIVLIEEAGFILVRTTYHLLLVSPN